jgi:hypothetical protein
MFEALLGRSTYLHRGLPVLLGPIAMVMAAVWVTSEVPAAETIIATVVIAAALSWVVGQLFRPLVDQAQKILVRTGPYRRLYEDMDAVYFAYCVPCSEGTALSLDAILKGSRHYDKFFSECLLKEIIERTTSIMPIGVLISTAVFALNGGWEGTGLFAAATVGATALVYRLGLAQVESCFRWTALALEDVDDT